MDSIYFDSAADDSVRRDRVYGGQIFVLSPSTASLALTTLARHVIEEAFAPLDPLTAQFSLSPEQFAAIAGPLKTRLAHHPDGHRLLRDMLIQSGCDPVQTFFDVPKLRVVTHGDYLTAGVAYPLHVHRDTWYSAPLSQLNWWMPLYPFEGNSSMAFYPKYWKTPIANDSTKFNYYDWNRDRRTAMKLVTRDTRFQPAPQDTVDVDSQVRIVCPPGAIILFSGAQLHSTVPNTSGRTRLSIDFRTVNLGDLESGRGAPNVDSAGQGTSLRDFRRVTDLCGLPAEVVAKYDDPAALRGRQDDLVFSPESV